MSLVPINKRYVPISRSARVHSGTSDMLDPSMCRLITGDSRKVLAKLGDGSIQCIVTSPAFWPTRRTFGGKGLGLERTFGSYLASFLAITAELRRVLSDHGVFWLHLEDSYSHNGGVWRTDTVVTWRPTSQKPLMETGVRMPDTTGMAPRKSLLMIPSRVILALMEQQGWVVRAEIIWDKGFAKPDSADDRPTVTHAKLFMLTKRPDYAYDADPLRVPAVGPGRKLNHMPKRPFSTPGKAKPGIMRRDAIRDTRVYQNPLGRNSGTVWRCNVANYRGDHTATFPLPLVRRMVLASCLDPDAVVLDPFGGSGTVAIAAMQCGFRAVSIDIHKGYTKEAKERIGTTSIAWEDEPEPDADPRMAELEAENAHLQRQVQMLKQQANVSAGVQAIAGLGAIATSVLVGSPDSSSELSSGGRPLSYAVLARLPRIDKASAVFGRDFRGNRLQSIGPMHTLP
jgi:site-specific DNA-methyltransferase (cytosine-N4-specific)